MNQSSSSEIRMYSDLAWLWPVISLPEDYVTEALQFAGLIRQFSVTKTSAVRTNRFQPGEAPQLTILHLGCGGGHLDHTLKNYFTITGVDLSTEMLALARQLNPEASYLQGDLRKLALEQRFDAVMIADSIDYMLDEDDLRAVFRVAYQHLNPGGVFVTYAEELTEHFENNRTDSVLHARGDLQVTLVENLYDPDPHDSTYEMTFVYLIRKSGRLTIEVDRHLAGIFEEATWLRLLEEAGFELQPVETELEGLRFFVGTRNRL